MKCNFSLMSYNNVLRENFLLGWILNPDFLTYMRTNHYHIIRDKREILIRISHFYSPLHSYSLLKQGFFSFNINIS